MVLLFLFSGATCKFINRNITILFSAFRVTLISVTVFSQINHFVMNNVYWHAFCVFRQSWKVHQTHKLHLLSILIIVSSKCLCALAAPNQVVMGNSRKYPYPTTDGFQVLTPPSLRKFQNALPPMPSEFHNREPPSPSEFPLFFGSIFST